MRNLDTAKAAVKETSCGIKKWESGGATDDSDARGLRAHLLRRMSLTEWSKVPSTAEQEAQTPLMSVSGEAEDSLSDGCSRESAWN